MDTSTKLFYKWSSSNFFCFGFWEYTWALKHCVERAEIGSIFGVIIIALATVENYFYPKVVLLYMKISAHKKKSSEIAYWSSIFLGFCLILFLSQQKSLCWQVEKNIIIMIIVR
jgi:hypothetical protein